MLSVQVGENVRVTGFLTSSGSIIKARIAPKNLSLKHNHYLLFISMPKKYCSVLTVLALTCLPLAGKGGMARPKPFLLPLLLPLPELLLLYPISL